MAVAKGVAVGKRFGLVAVIGGLLVPTGTVAAAAIGTSSSATGSHSGSNSSTSTSIAVGPSAGDGSVGDPVRPAERASPGGGPSASQMVNGVVASTSAVSVSATGQTTYRGTEPAQMTVQNTGSQVTVTVAPW